MAEKKRGGGFASLVRNAGQAIKRETINSGAELILDADGNSAPQVPKIFSILDYIEQPWGLSMKLYPAQRFLVKLYYFIPLDNKEKTIFVTDMFNTKVLHSFTEAEYLNFLYQEGRCNIGVQDHLRRDLVLAIGRRAGKCVAQGTLIPTSKGVFRIEDLGEAPDEEHIEAQIGIAQEAGRRATATSFYNGGVKPTFTVKTKSSYTVTGTANHRVKVMATSGHVEWCYLDEVKPGDFVALNRTTDLWATEYLDLRPYHNEDGYKDMQLPTVLDARLGSLMGYLVGDGTWGNTQGLSVTVEHPETWDQLHCLFTGTFGEPRVQMDKRTANTGRIEVCGVRARRFMAALGWSLDCARDAKMVPWAILQSPKDVVCAFLRGLFETDGCAESGGRNITLSSASFRLAHEVQLLLLNLGILSNVSRKWIEKTKKHYAILSIKGVRSRQLFAQLVGFDSDKKRIPMLQALVCAQEGKSDTENIPHQHRAVRDWLESIPKRNPGRGELGWGRSKLRAVLGNACKPNSGEGLTYPRLNKALDIAKELSAGAAETAHFEDLLRLDYFYDAVVSVELGEDHVYDLTVPDGESFVANGMTNHNTTLSGIFASYEIYRLLNLHNPQRYYGLPDGNRIQIISVATDQDQASLLYNEVTSHLAKCDYFKPFIANNTQKLVNFRTPFDIDRYGPTSRMQDGKFVSFNGKASLRVTFKSCIAKGLRGSGNVMVILDEAAHFQDKGQSSAKDIYDAVTPSTAAYSPKNPLTGMPINGPKTETDARVILISSPLGKSGKFFELYDDAMHARPGSENLLAIQAPTWEINPTIATSYYRRKYHEDPAVFMVEHGANFSDQLRGWIEREQDLFACIDPEARPTDRGMPRYPYQMGVDVGLVGDGTAIVITCPVGDKVVLAYHETWTAGVPWHESNPHLSEPLTPYARTLAKVERLDFDELSVWIAELNRRFYITDGMFDRWSGIPLEQALHKRGLTQYHSDFFTRDQSSKMYQTTKMLMFDERVSLYDFPIPGEGVRHSPLIKELLQLQANQVSNHMVMVEAPKVSGAHDDVSDALVRAVWLTHERLSNQKFASGGRNPGSEYHPHAAAPMSTRNYQATRARRHGLTQDRPATRMNSRMR